MNVRAFRSTEDVAAQGVVFGLAPELERTCAILLCLGLGQASARPIAAVLDTEEALDGFLVLTLHDAQDIEGGRDLRIPQPRLPFTKDNETVLSL